VLASKSEPDDVDVFVGGIEPDASAPAATARFIEEYKKRPDYRVEAEEAERILAVLGINFRDYGMTSAQSLLEHWHRCVADLREADSGDGRVEGVDHETQGGNGCASPDRSKETLH
jgi:hypothetical protein